MGVKEVLKRIFPQDSVFRRGYRRLRTVGKSFYSNYEGFLFISDPPPDSLPSAETLLGEGESFVDLTPELIELNSRWLPPRQIERFRKQLEPEKMAGGIVNAEGRLIAWYCLSSGPAVGSAGNLVFRPRGVGYVYNDWVIPAERGRGLGFLMNLYRLQRFGRELRIVAIVRKDNPPALRNWEKCGQKRKLLLQCRKRFFRPWIHQAIPLEPEVAELPLDRTDRHVNLMLNGPEAEWRDGGFRIIRFPRIKAQKAVGTREGTSFFP